MPDLEVTQEGALGSFLRRNGVQPWRVSILVSTRGVVVKRGDTRVTPLTEGTALRARDLFSILDPHSRPPQPPSSEPSATPRRTWPLCQGRRTSTARWPCCCSADLRPRSSPTLSSHAHGVPAGAGVEPAIDAPIRDLMVSSPTHVTYADLEAAVRARSIDVAPEVLQRSPWMPTGTPSTLASWCGAAASDRPCLTCAG